MSRVFKPNDPQLSEQWHLINTGKAGSVGNDANVLPAWQSVTGKGVVIGVVDDGVLGNHSDLKDRYRKDLSFDFDNNDPDPTPQLSPGDYGVTEELISQISDIIKALKEGSASEGVLQPLLDRVAEELEYGGLPETLTAVLGEMSTAVKASLKPDQAITALEGFQKQLQELPTPPQIYASHGTAVAGVAAATGNNGIGVTGVAPGASLAGIKWTGQLLDVKEDGPNYDELVDQREAQALSHQNQEIAIYNNSWGPQDDGRTLEGPGIKTLAAIEESVRKGRGGLGNIYVWAAGNGGEANDNVNYDGYANSRYTIAVGAIGADGVQTSYSEPGAALFVTAYSANNEVGITTTAPGAVGDKPNSASQYTDGFGGTSSSAPLVSGVVALMLEANPNLTWRDVQHILAKTAVKNDANDADWTLNGAGYHVNHKYGFGAVDAAAAVNLAKTWKTVLPETSATSEDIQVNSFVPDNRALGLTSLVTIGQNLNLESVEVVFDALHAYRGDLEVTLTSPDGSQSILAEKHNDDGNDYAKWTFSSVRHWGESSLGDWLLRVADKTGQGIGGLWNSWKLNLYGTENKALPNLKALVGNDEANVLHGSGRDELIQGLSGNDRLHGRGGNDQIQGGVGDDRLLGEDGRDKLWGGDGQDQLLGGDGVDYLYGQQGVDDLQGGAGNDVLVGGSGQDSLTGGAGSDRFVYESAQDGDDTITDFNAAEDLIDLHKIWRGVASKYALGDKASLSDIYDRFISVSSVSDNAVQVGIKSPPAEGETPTYLATLQGVSTNDLSVSNFIF